MGKINLKEFNKGFVNCFIDKDKKTHVNIKLTNNVNENLEIYPFNNYYHSEPLGFYANRSFINHIIDEFGLLYSPNELLADKVFEIRYKGISKYSDDEDRYSTWTAITESFFVKVYKDGAYYKSMDDKDIEKFLKKVEIRYSGTVLENGNFEIYDEVNDLYKFINPNSLAIEPCYRKMNELTAKERHEKLEKFSKLYVGSRVGSSMYYYDLLVDLEMG